MKRQLKVMLAAATIILGFVSLPAYAEFIMYEFVDGPNSDSRLTGSFRYDGESAFTDILMTVSFGGAFGDVTFDTFRHFNPGSVNEFFTFTSSTFESLSTSSVDYTASLSIEPIFIRGTTPVAVDTGTAYWAAVAHMVAESENVETSAQIGTFTLSETGISTETLNRTAFQAAPVPEPATYAMMAIGLLGIAGMRRRQNKA